MFMFLLETPKVLATQVLGHRTDYMYQCADASPQSPPALGPPGFMVVSLALHAPKVASAAFPRLDFSAL